MPSRRTDDIIAFRFGPYRELHPEIGQGCVDGAVEAVARSPAQRIPCMSIWLAEATREADTGLFAFMLMRTLSGLLFTRSGIGEIRTICEKESITALANHMPNGIYGKETLLTSIASWTIDHTVSLDYQTSLKHY